MVTLQIKNGERRWYALKDKKLVHKVKGAIQLEMDFVYNHVSGGQAKEISSKEILLDQVSPCIITLNAFMSLWVKVRSAKLMLFNVWELLG